MHSDLKVTDGIYAVLSNTDVKEAIQQLGKSSDNENIVPLLEKLIKEINSNSS